MSKINSMTFAEKQAMVGKTIPASTKQPCCTRDPLKSEGEFEVYTVRSGDTIWDIVKMYDNVTATDVLTSQ